MYANNVLMTELWHFVWMVAFLWVTRYKAWMSVPNVVCICVAFLCFTCYESCLVIPLSHVIKFTIESIDPKESFTSYNKCCNLLRRTHSLFIWFSVQYHCYIFDIYKHQISPFQLQCCFLFTHPPPPTYIKFAHWEMNVLQIWPS